MKTKTQTRNETKYQEMLAQHELTRIEARRKRWEAFWKFMNDLGVLSCFAIAAGLVWLMLMGVVRAVDYVHTTRIEEEQAIELGKSTRDTLISAMNQGSETHHRLNDSIEILNGKAAADAVILGELRRRIVKLENPTPAPQWQFYTNAIQITNIPITYFTNLNVYGPNCITNENPKPVILTNMEWHYYYYDK